MATNPSNYLMKGDSNVRQWKEDFQLLDNSGNVMFGVTAAGNVSCNGTITSAGSTDNNGNLSITNSAPFISLLTTDTGDKQLKIKLGEDVAFLQEVADTDGALLTLDLANHRLGIAKASPAQALDVTGNLALSGNAVIGGSLSSDAAALTSDGSGNLTAVSLTVSGNIVLGSASLLDLSAITAGNANVKITATNATPSVTWTGSSGSHINNNAPAGYLQILVGSSARYIPFWA